jgi:hypothetical protein
MSPISDTPNLIECLACGNEFEEDEMTVVPLGGGEHDWLCPTCAWSASHAAAEHPEARGAP